MLAGCSPAGSESAPRAAPGCSPRYSGDAQGMFPGMLPGMPAGARGSLTACSPKHLEDAPGMLGGRRPGCSGTLPGMLGAGARGCSPACSGDVSRLPAGRPGAARPAALPALRSAPRAAAGGAAGPEGGSGAGRGWCLQPGSPAGQAPLTRLLCKWSSPVPPASLTSSPPAGRQGRGVPGPPTPGARHRAGSATPPGIPPSGDPAAPPPPQPGTQEGHGWARPAACARSTPAARHPPPPCPGTLGVRPVLPEWVQGERAVGGQETEPGRLRVRGWAWGWHGVAWGGGHALTHSRTHAKVREY